MVDPGFGSAVISWPVTKLLDELLRALKDTVKLPNYCGQLNVYVLRIRALVSVAQASSSTSAALPQGNGDIEVKEWLQDVEVVLEEAILLVAKCGALPAGKLNSVKHCTKRLKLSRRILSVTRRLKEVASTEATWACLAKQMAIQDSVAAQGYLVEKILKGTEDNQILVKEVRGLLDKRKPGNGMEEEAVEQLVEQFHRVEVQVSEINQDLVHEIQELRTEVKQTGEVVSYISCRTTQILDISTQTQDMILQDLVLSTQTRDMMHQDLVLCTQTRDMMRDVLEGVSQMRSQMEELRPTSGVPRSLPSTSTSMTYSGNWGPVSMANRIKLVSWRWRGSSNKQDADLIAILRKRALGITLMPLSDLQNATNNFSKSSEIGTGCYHDATVYLGELKDGTKVAIKRFLPYGRSEFLTEVEILSRVHHRHLVRLVGFSMQSKNLALVLEYVPNGTLAEHLFHDGWGRRREFEGAVMSWERRLLIAVQISDALAYLHSAADPPIFHADVNLHNILLDEDLNAKLGNFSGSDLAPIWTTRVQKPLRGTLGYLDPEFCLTGELTAKSDVYGFGMVLLELMAAYRVSCWSFVGTSCGSDRTRLVDLLETNPEQAHDMVISVMRNGDLERLIDPCLLDIYNTPTGNASIQGACALAAECLARTSPERPEMQEVRNRLQTLYVQYQASSRGPSIM